MYDSWDWIEFVCFWYRFWEIGWIVENVDEWVVDFMFCVVHDDMMDIRPVNVFVNQFGWLGDQNWVFGWKWGLKIVVLETAQMNTRSSEQTVAQASDTVPAQNWNLPVRSSVPQANSKRAKPDVTTFWSLKRAARRLSEQREFLSRILKIVVRSSEPYASCKRAKPKLSSFGSLKRAV